MAEKRGSLFTVRDAESAIVTYTVSGWNGVLQMLVKLDATSPVFNRTAIAFIVFQDLRNFGHSPLSERRNL